MNRQTTPISKNTPLDISISKMENALNSINADIVFKKEANPISNCFWINLNYSKAPELIYSNGKGTSYQEAKASALGEFIERLQTNNFFSEFYLPNNVIYPDQKLFNINEKILDKKLEDIYNANKQLENSDLIDFNTSYQDKIIALPFKNLNDNKEYYFPLNILHNLYVSNGLATGNSKTEATIQALSEIYERYVKIEVIKNGYALPLFPKEIVDNFLKLKEDINTLEQNGYIVNVHDASLGGQFPVTAISIINPKNSTIFLSFGSHPILEASLQRTMTELMQGRDLSKMDNFKRATFNSEIVADYSNIESHFIDSNGQINFRFLSSKKSFNYTPWKYNKSSQEEELKFLIDIAKSLDKDIYIREYDYLGFDSVQVIIPNFSEIYPIDDLIYNNTNSAKWLREYILNLPTLNQDELEECLNLIEAIDENIDVASYIGVIFKKSFSIKLLKAAINLKLENYKEASYLLEDSKDITAYALSQLCQIFENNFNWQDYEESLYKIFPKEKLDLAISIFNGEKELIDISFDNRYKDILKLYEELNSKKVENI